MKSIIFLLISVVSAILALTFTRTSPLVKLINGNNLLTAKLYKEILNNNNNNFIVSPLSAQIILALSQSGGKDATAQEIRSALNLPNTDEETKPVFKSLLSYLKSNDARYYLLHSANKIYVKQQLSIKNEFKTIANDVYEADLENIDFSRKAEAVRTINNWVERKTDNKIHDLIKSDDIDGATALILVNALHFKGRWVNKFNDRNTRKANFYKSPNNVIQVDTMNHHGFYFYYESPELKAKFLEIPFAANDVSMYIALPNEKDGLAALEAEAEKVFIDHEFVMEEVKLSLPKFRVDSRIDLKEILKKLGVIKAFSNQADFSGIAGRKGDLSINKVIQKGFISVDEQGAEAAAATLVELSFGASAPSPLPPKKFFVDHPFIFYIKIKGVVVFAGRVIEP